VSALLLVLVLLVGGAHAEPMSPEGWRTLVRNAQQQVAAGTPHAVVSMRRLGDRQVRGPEGGVVAVDDRELLRLTAELEHALTGPDDPLPALRETALYLAQLEGEVDKLLEEPPPPYSQAIRPDGALFATTTRPLQPARTTAPWEPALRSGWGRVRAWVGIAMSGRGSGGSGLTAVVLVGTSVAALLLALWPVIRRLGAAGPTASRGGGVRPGRLSTPLGRRLLAILDALARRGLIRAPAHLTNGEVLRTLPESERQLLAPAIRVHDLSCYGERAAGPAEHALLEALQRRLERAP
jgi:hypothetical protein